MAEPHSDIKMEPMILGEDENQQHHPTLTNITAPVTNTNQTSNFIPAPPKPVAVYEFKPNAASPIVTYVPNPLTPATPQQPTGASASVQQPTEPFDLHMADPGDSAGFTLADLVSQIDEYPPTIPDSVANHFLHMAGFESSDPRISRLLSLAAQKYISDILNDAFTHCKLRGVGGPPTGGSKNKVKDKKYVLTMDDLSSVLNDHGITVRKPPYFV